MMAVAAVAWDISACDCQITLTRAIMNNESPQSQHRKSRHYPLTHLGGLASDARLLRRHTAAEESEGTLPLMQQQLQIHEICCSWLNGWTQVTNRDLAGEKVVVSDSADSCSQWHTLLITFGSSIRTHTESKRKGLDVCPPIREKITHRTWRGGRSWSP